MPVAVACRAMGVSRSGFYQRRNQPETLREGSDAELVDTIRDVWEASRCTYGARRVHAELKLGLNRRVGRCRVERLMKHAGIQGLYRRRKQGWTVRNSGAEVMPDLVDRNFKPAGLNRLWCADITQHRTSEGWVYIAAVIDAYSRRGGWLVDR